MAEVRKSAPKQKQTGGDKRRTQAAAICSRVKDAVNNYEISGLDDALQRVVGLLAAKDKLLAELLPEISTHHITQKLVNELFFHSMQLEEQAKAMLQKLLIKNSKDKKRTTQVLSLNKNYKMTSLKDLSGFHFCETNNKREHDIVGGNTSGNSISLQKHTSQTQENLQRLDTELRTLGADIGYSLPSVDWDYSKIRTDYQIKNINNEDHKNLLEKLNHHHHIVCKLSGQAAQAKKTYVNKNDAFKRDFLKKNSLEFLPDDEDENYESYKTKMIHSSNSERLKKESAIKEKERAENEFELTRRTLDNKTNCFLKVVEEWEFAKVKEEAFKSTGEKLTPTVGVSFQVQPTTPPLATPPTAAKKKDATTKPAPPKTHALQNASMFKTPDSKKHKRSSDDADTTDMQCATKKSPKKTKAGGTDPLWKWPVEEELLQFIDSQGENLFGFPSPPGIRQH